MSFYTDLIIKLSGCTVEEAPMVESLLRDLYRTLDHLPRARFKKEAMLALRDLRADPELRMLLQAETRPAYAGAFADVVVCGEHNCAPGTRPDIGDAL